MRLIDDFSACGVNATVGLPEKLRVESVGQVVAIIPSMMRFRQTLSRLPWTGRTFDLKAAYKKFGVSLDESNRLKIAIKSGQNDVSFYNVLALPFGATGSVVAFLRIAAALSFIGTRGLLICWSIFFDDFTAVAPEKVAGNTQLYIEFLFRLLGVDFAGGDKAPPFAPLFKSLGLQFDLDGVGQGSFSLGHTAAGRSELLDHRCDMISVDGPGVSPKELERLHGRLVWFNSFVFGRTLKAAVSVVSKYARASTSKVGVQGHSKMRLLFFKESWPGTNPSQSTVLQQRLGRSTLMVLSNQMVR